MRFEWDPAKDEANRSKHGLGFDEAKELFVSGADYLEIPDERYSEVEERFLAIGPIERGVVLVVWTERAVMSFGSSARGSRAGAKSSGTATTWTATDE